MSAPLAFACHSGIARITLDRPEVGNAIDLELGAALIEAAKRCASDPAIRCVMLTGAGRMFCAGGDIRTFTSPGDDDVGDVVGELARRLHVAMTWLAHMQKPLVVLVNGPAAGAGFSLSMLGDIVLAARSAHFTAGYSAIGLTPDGGLTWTLPRLIGLRKAQEIILTNRRVDAQEGEAIGLVTRIVEDSALEAEGDAIADQLCRGPTLALAAIRSLLREGATVSLETQLEREGRAIAIAAAAPEGKEGAAAFLEKRKARFPGVEGD